MAADPFDDVLNLEDKYYNQGYKQGYEDGFQAGKIEGRSVGLKKGFEKFLEAGRLQGKALVWANREPEILKRSTALESGSDAQKLRPLKSNLRLAKNIELLYALVEPDTLSTENDNEAVNDFDDRFKRAQGRQKIVERAIGEGVEMAQSSESSRPVNNEI